MIWYFQLAYNLKFGFEILKSIIANCCLIKVISFENRFFIYISLKIIKPTTVLARTLYILILL